MNIAYCKNPKEKKPSKLEFVCCGETYKLDTSIFLIRRKDNFYFKDPYKFIQRGLSQFQFYHIKVDNARKCITMMKNYNYRLPIDTIRYFNDRRSNEGFNFGLKLNKIAKFEKDKFQLLTSNDEKILSKHIIDDNVLHSINDRIFDIFKEIFDGSNRILCSFSTSWRLAIGLGIESVYETGLSLHPVYGFPMIPASSIKGILRSWIIEEVFYSNESDAMKKSKLFCDIFGCDKASWYGTSMRGKVTFFDSYPKPGFWIEPEVMTPHYAEYYTGKMPPADWHKPTPIFFLTVANATFEFLIGWSKSFPELGSYGKKATEKNTTTPDPFYEVCIKRFGNDAFNLKMILEGWLKDALGNHGIGAKTAVGYGRMK